VTALADISQSGLSDVLLFQEVVPEKITISK